MTSINDLLQQKTCLTACGQAAVISPLAEFFCDSDKLFTVVLKDIYFIRTRGEKRDADSVVNFEKLLRVDLKHEIKSTSSNEKLD